MGLSWASHSTSIYTSELILCSTICVHSATRRTSFEKRNNLDELINILIKAEERFVIQISLSSSFETSSCSTLSTGANFCSPRWTAVWYTFRARVPALYLVVSCLTHLMRFRHYGSIMVEIDETEDENDGWPKVTENQTNHIVAA